MAGPLKAARKRKYQEELIIKYGFTSVVINAEERSQCVICCEVLANESFKVNKLIRHLKTKHDSLADRGTEFLKRKAQIVKKKLDLIVLDLTNKKMLLPLKLHISLHKELKRLRNRTQ
jgi:hypothetical protein